MKISAARAPIARDTNVALSAVRADLSFGTRAERDQ
jgi:hypothetical protein